MLCWRYGCALILSNILNKNDGLDQYQILCLHQKHRNPRHDGLDLNLKIDQGASSCNKFEFVVARRKHTSTLEFSSLQFAFQRHATAEVIEDFCISRSKFKWTMQRWMLCCQYLQFLGINLYTQWHLQCTFDRSLRSIVENSFAT